MSKKNKKLQMTLRSLRLPNQMTYVARYLLAELSKLFSNA